MLGPHCADCGGGDNLCDYPVGKNKTCDRSICKFDSNEVGPNLHYCNTHFGMWTKYRESGGEAADLKNVMAFIPRKLF